MPGIYRLKCDSCEYSVQGGMSQTSVVREDGSEEAIGPNPLMFRMAEEATGKSWKELKRTHRIVYRYALTCLSCGKLDYYGPRDIQGDSSGRSHIGSIVYHEPSIREAERYTCRSCGKSVLYPLCGQTSWFPTLWKLIGVGRRKVYCPMCKTGSLSSERLGIL